MSSEFTNSAMQEECRRTTMRSGVNPIRASESRSPTASRNRAPFGLSWIPAPTSPKCYDGSIRSASWPRRRKHRASVRPAMPASYGHSHRVTRRSTKTGPYCHALLWSDLGGARLWAPPA
jgi:hypothetical protein